MKRFNNKWVLIIGVILLFSVLAMSQAEQKRVLLTLDDCIVKAMSNNLNLAIEELNPRLSDISVSQSREKYLPQLSFSVNKRNTSSASYSWLDAADQVETQYQFYTAQYTQAVPTGAQLSVSVENSQNETNRRFQTINPRYGSTLTFDFVQPLLRNFGFKVNNREIIVAKNNREISNIQFKSTLLETIYNVQSQYWNLVYSIENLKARQQSLELARDLLEKNRRSVEIGRMAPIDIQSAVAEVATREADILEAEALVQNNEDMLKNIINLKAEMGSDDYKVVPIDKPVIQEVYMTFQESLDLARKNRPDLQEIQLDLENSNINLSYAKNQLLPDLNLTASYWSPGISGTQIVYQNNDPTTGIILGTVPGGSSDALKDAFNFKYDNWTVGVSLDIPMNTLFARNQVEEAKVNIMQNKMRLQEIEQQILLDIKTASRAVETNLKRVNAYRIARELTQTKMETEAEKLRLGNSTNYDVFLFQRDLSEAQSSELQAIIDYNLSLAYREMVLGIGLEENRIKVK